MSKTIIYNFSDECGLYKKDPNEKTLISHPYYVRSNFIIDIDEYNELECKINEIKKRYSVPYNVEIKWAHLGSRLNRRKDIPHALTVENMRDYFAEVIKYICELDSAKIYYTFTENKTVGRVDEIKMIKMHLQNAFQRVQNEAQKKDGVGIMVVDDMNDQNKLLKSALFQLSTEGDQFTDYPNVQKGFFIDFSDMSCGLQIADILAGFFTASLKYISAPEEEKKKYEYAYGIFTNYIYKKIRNSDYNLPVFDVYKFGVKEVPTEAGKTIAEEISSIVAARLREDLETEIRNSTDWE